MICGQHLNQPTLQEIERCWQLGRRSMAHALLSEEAAAETQDPMALPPRSPSKSLCWPLRWMVGSIVDESSSRLLACRSALDPTSRAFDVCIARWSYKIYPDASSTSARAYISPSGLPPRYRQWTTSISLVIFTMCRWPIRAIPLFLTQAPPRPLSPDDNLELSQPVTLSASPRRLTSKSRKDGEHHRPDQRVCPRIHGRHRAFRLTPIAALRRR